MHDDNARDTNCRFNPTPTATGCETALWMMDATEYKHGILGRISSTSPMPSRKPAGSWRPRVSTALPPGPGRMPRPHPLRGVAGGTLAASQELGGQHERDNPALQDLSLKTTPVLSWTRPASARPSPASATSRSETSTVKLTAAMFRSRPNLLAQSRAGGCMPCTWEREATTSPTGRRWDLESRLR